MTTYVEGLSVTYPYRAVVHVTSTYADGYISSGSGVVVGTNDVLTASHMVYDSAHGVATSISVEPGHDDGSSPYGTFYADLFNYFRWDVDANDLVSTTEADEDIAVLGFSERLSDIVGSFGLDPNFYNGSVHVTGYPGVYAGTNGPKMTDDVGGAYSSDGVLYFDSDVEVNPGNSGGPIWYEDSGGPFVVGVVSTTAFGADIAAYYPEITNWMSGNDYLMDVIGPAETPGYILQVARLYEAGLDRSFDSGGLNYYIDLYEAGAALRTMAVGFLDSPEFTNAYGDDDAMSNADFINRMYLNVLDRAAEGSGFNYWMDQMSGGAAREDVLLNFAASPENVGNTTYLAGLSETSPGFWDL